MGYSIRALTADGPLCQHLTIETLERVVSPAAVPAALAATGRREQRQRALPVRAVVWTLLAMNRSTDVGLGAVLRKTVRGLRFIAADPDAPRPTASALTYRRSQVGVAPLVELCHQVCRPLATPATPGAFRFGVRLMALDGSVDLVPDTPANAAVFGRPTTQQGACALPQVQAVYLGECGTHAVVAAGFWPSGTSERLGAKRLLRSVGPGMLVRDDRGLHRFDLLVGVRPRQAHVLGRLPANIIGLPVPRLADGSFLTSLPPADEARRRQGERGLVRVVEYRLTDPALPGHGAVHRLVTTRLDPDEAPAREVVCAYHERWEIEVVVDELQTHQRLAGQPVRSRQPVGVVQERYALVIAQYAVRFLMHEAARAAGVDPDRLSLVRAVAIITEAIPEFQMVARRQVEQLYRRLLADLAAEPLPARRHRCNPRVIKRQQSKFPRKRVAHAQARQPQCPFAEAVVVLAAPCPIVARSGVVPRPGDRPAVPAAAPAA